MSNTSPINIPFNVSHAFIIGINAYQYLSPLNTAVADATRLAEVLEKDHRYTVHPPLLNATAQEIQYLLTTVFQEKIKAEDRILFYFAGHGVAMDGDDGPNGYLLPADAKLGDQASLIAMDTLREAFDGLACKHGLIIMDCCFSGAFKWSTGSRDSVFDLPSVIYQQRYDQYTHDKAWQVITSSSSDQKASDFLGISPLGSRNQGTEMHSPFAMALFDALDGEGDVVPKGKGDGIITGTELYTYLRDRVEDETMEHGNRQSPALFTLKAHDKGQYIFYHPRHPYNLPDSPERNPYMGLKSYSTSEEDARLFYGRDRVIEALNDLIQTVNFVVVSGASGTGKSSVIKAGLLPKMRKDGWKELPVLRPGKFPMQRIQKVLPNIPKEEKCLLVIDQYEELITQSESPNDRDRFESQVATLLTDYPLLKIIISVRSDFEPQFEQQALKEVWKNGRYVIPTFSQEELREVILKPAIQEVLFFEPESLVDTLVDAVNQAPGALPLLSFTLSEMYESYVKRHGKNRALTQADYDSLGGVIGALRTKADTLFNELDHAEQLSMKKLMLRMVSREGVELASKRVLKKDLEYEDGEETQRINSIAEKLMARRLILSGQDLEGQEYYEPAHDALILAWKRLWQWIKDEGDVKLARMKAIHEASIEYAEQGFNKKYLWNSDPRLKLVKEDSTIGVFSLNKVESNFLHKSLKRENNITWAIRGIVTAVIAGLSVLSVFLFQAQQTAIKRAEEIEATTLVVQSKAAISTDRKEALDLAFFAHSHAPTKSSAEALYELLSNFSNKYYHQSLNLISGLLGNTIKDKYRQGGTNDFSEILDIRPPNLEVQKDSSEAKNEPSRFYAHSANFLNNETFLVGGWARWGGLTDLSASYEYPLQAYTLHNKANYTWDTLATNFLGHLANIKAVIVPPNQDEGSTNKYVATISLDGQAIIWDLTEQKVFKRTSLVPFYDTRFNPERIEQNQAAQRANVLDTDRMPVSGTFSQDGNTLAIASPDGTIWTWNWKTTSQAQRYSVSSEVRDVQKITASFRPNQILIAGDQLIAWSIDTQEFEAIADEPINTPGKITEVALFPEEPYLVVGESGGILRVFDDQGIHQIAKHDGKINALAIAPGGQFFLSGDQYGVIHLWDKALIYDKGSGEGFPSQQIYGHTSPIMDISISPDGKHFISIDFDGIARVWSMDALIVPQLYDVEHSMETLYAGESEGEMFIGEDQGTESNSWNFLTASPLRQRQNFSGFFTPKYTFNAFEIATDDVGNPIKMIYSTHDIEEGILETDIIDLTTSQDGTFSLIRDSQRNILFWDNLVERPIMCFRVPGFGIESIAFSKAHTHIVLGLQGNKALTLENPFHLWERAIIPTLSLQ